ncbi:hypothetical protein QZH41_002749 [Actinostola sp. cb2023]|nr:hypothetical protein QZH41_002749 [Actinostola sp. cb2023]
MQAIVSREDLFKCPAVNYGPYGWMFIFAPGLLLFLVSLFLNGGFWKVAQGCCHYGSFPNVGLKRRACPCFFPRWGCSKKLLEVLFYSSVASCLWIVWGFLQGEYYTCAMLGNKAARLFNTTTEQKKVILIDFSKANDTSQVIAFSLLAFMLGIPFIVLTAYRCCCLLPQSTIPSPYSYLKLEAKSAVEAFKAKMESLAQDQGKRRADLYFAEQIKSEKTPSDILIQAYQDLTKIDEYAQSFQAIDEYKKMEANAAQTAFKAKAESVGKDHVALTFQDKTWSEYEKKNPFLLIENVFDSMVDRYPRSTGDRSKPYVKMNEDGNQRQIRHDAFAMT